MAKQKANVINTTALGKRNWMLIWIIGMAGQIAWNIENNWFNTFVYEKIGYVPDVIAWMVGVSAAVTTIVTFLFGTLSDRIGKRKPFIVFGYILWGLATIGFGFTELIYQSLLARGLSIAFTIAALSVISADAIMSAFGSMGNDAGFNAWTTDISNESNRGKLSGALAIMPVLATIVGTIGSGFIIERFDYFGFFIIMGLLVISIGVFSLFFMKDSPTLSPRVEGSFGKQFLSVFNLKYFKENKELALVFIFLASYFIGFNVYFPYMLVFIQYTLEIEVGMSGLILGIGLIFASIVVIPASRLIERGKSPFICLLAIIVNTLGLIVVSISVPSTPYWVLGLGVFLVGAGYISVLQALTAWMKNLYPEKQRGQFEGLRIVFAVLLPMVIGPIIGTNIIKAFGTNGVQWLTDTIYVEGPLPPQILFIVGAVVTLFSLIPLYYLNNQYLNNRKIKNSNN
ncbi:MAG: MFS transporter [Tenericutes bacterium HGW-Tenericutes-1]|jgi:MFS family permease|nr:MAG: MFS transporter [Tenericutes bacterium HGW-Tenericutes-1]